MEEELENLRRENESLQRQVQELSDQLSTAQEKKPQQESGSYSNALTKEDAQEMVNGYLGAITITDGGDIIVVRSGPGQFSVTARGS